jgi:glycosyltransferase involved in cell wall biosynthesis
MERPLRVAYITHYTELYGANRSLIDMMCALRKDHQVVPHVILPASGPLSQELDRLGIPWASIPFRPWMTERHYSGRWYHRIFQYLGHRREARARGIHNSGLGPDLLGLLARWDVALVHVNSAAVGLITTLQRMDERPLVWHIRELPEAHYGLHIDGGRSSYARALRKATAVVTISKVVQDDLRDRGRADGHCIPDGVLSTARMLELEREQRSAHVAEDPFTLLQVGLIHPSKGQLEAVEAVHLLRRNGRHVRLIIAGSGRDKALRERIVALGLTDHVHVQGFVSDPFPLYQAADVLVMCSRHEALGRVTIEAMASGLPVIGHCSGATPEVLGDGAYGVLYTGGPTELAQHVARLMDDVPLRVRLASAARHVVRERYTTERCGQAVSTLYDRLSSGRKR